MTDLVERLVPDELWVLFRRVVLQRLGRHRWAVERTVSWLAGCRRLHRRYERKAEHSLAFVGIAAALICHRRVTARHGVWRPKPAAAADIARPRLHSLRCTGKVPARASDPSLRQAGSLQIAGHLFQLVTDSRQPRNSR